MVRPPRNHIWIVTARKRSLRRLCFYRCLSVHGGGAWRPPLAGRPPGKETPLARRPPWQGDPLARKPPAGRPPGKETPLPGRPPLPRRPPPGPHPRGKLRGIRSRPTPKGEIEGDQIQAHTQGGNWRGSGTGQHPRGKLRGIRTKLPLMTTAMGGTHPTGMHSCFCRGESNH